MNIIIVGCGKVGYTLARQLNGEGHDITVIEPSAERIQSVSGSLDVQMVNGSGTSVRTLREANVEEADLLIAVTDQDEVNLLSCLIAEKTSHCRTVARVRNPEYFEEIAYIRQCMGTSLIINPEFSTAREIAHLIEVPSAMEIDSFAKGSVDLLKLEIPAGSILDGMRVDEFSARFNRQALICIRQRGREIEIPNGATVLEQRDIIYIILPPRQIRSFCESVGLSVRPLRRVMIAGGSTISYYLAKRLLKNGFSVTIVEKKYSRCEFLSDALPEANIVYGDATDYEMLLEEGLTGMDAFVALTSLDEENVFLSLYANKMAPRCKKITKNNHLSLDDIVESLPVGSLVSPKDITAEYISQYVRSLNNSHSSNVEAVYRLVGGQVEALEFRLKEQSAVTGKPLMDLRLKDNLLICCILRDGKIITPGGRDTLEKGDTVVVVTTHRGLGDIREILRSPLR
ncbi:MAG: Trk system potassium transporter TrkA [Lachnospiraceae bacterium]|nr:Trk system potassium transporter TrkA [Lachnospiraceae bacterium]